MNTLKIALRNHLGLVPPVLALLAGEVPDAYRWFKLRHPGGIFNSQSGNVAQDLIYALDDLERFRVAVDYASPEGNTLHQERITRLIRTYTLLLFSLENYIESAYEILLAFCPKQPPPGEAEFLWKWLRSKGYSAGGDFHRAVISDVAFFHRIFNKLKHTSNALRLALVRVEGVPRDIVAYYLEAPTTEGALGPDEGLHPLLGNSATANSFNRDLRIMYFAIYKVADDLGRVLVEHHRQIYSRELIPNGELRQDDSAWRKLFGLMGSLGNDYVPHEFGTEVPNASIVNENGSTFLVFDINRIRPIAGARYHLIGSTRGDGFSKSFRFPYFGRPA